MISQRIGWDYYQSPLLREIWEDRKKGFNPDFVTFYENEIWICQMKTNNFNNIFSLLQQYLLQQSAKIL